MNNLEKLTAGEVAARNNGTLEQLREVVGHCFPNNTRQINGGAKYYFKHANSITSEWDCNSYSPYKAIDITQLWEELQALKKPEIWHIKVTYQNNKEVSNWLGATLIDDNDVIAGMFKSSEGKIDKGSYFSRWLNNKGAADFGNEIDFPTFLKYTGVEVEKVEPIKGSTFEDTISELTQLINKRVDLRIKSDRLNDELTEINTKISALLK